MDNMTKNQRSHTMSRIRSRETEPEKKLRSAMHRKGYRFRKNVRSLPGTPDIVLPKFRTVIFINGCFWHQHPDCPRAVMPKSNKRYWEVKLKKNVKQDEDKTYLLTSLGWKVITVWECEIKKSIENVVSIIVDNLPKQRTMKGVR